MSHITKEEYLSAFVDGEAGSFEEHRICDQLLADEMMREKLTSYALIGESIRDRSQSDDAIASPSFLSGIQDLIAEDEPLAVVPDDSTVISLDAARTEKKRTLPRRAVGYAVAASAAAVAAISFQNYNATSQPEKQIVNASLSKSAEKVNASSVMMSAKPSIASIPEAKQKPQAVVKSDFLIATSYKAPDAKTRGLMNKYVAHHLQYASSSTLMPRVRAVSYSTDF